MATEHQSSPTSIFHLCGGRGAQHPSFIFVVDAGHKQSRNLKTQVAKHETKKRRPVAAIANKQDA